MNTEFIEKYSKLSDMTPGDSAASKDRRKFFVCGNIYDTIKKKDVPVILELNNLWDQNTEKRDMSQPVKILKCGDKFVCSS